MSFRIAVANQKGGVGKTTTSVNLAASLAHLGDPVLLIDMDPQANATTASGIDKSAIDGSSICDWLLDELEWDELLKHAEAAGYDVLPANADLTAAEVALLGGSRREGQLRALLGARTEPYRWVIIDCPPSLNMLTLNALVAADGVLIPMQCEYYALEGLSDLLDTINGVREAANPSLRIEGLLRTMYDPRSALTRDVSRQLIRHFGDAVYRTVIPRNVRLAEAPSHGLPAMVYDPGARGAVAYLALASEIRRAHEVAAEAEGRA